MDRKCIWQSLMSFLKVQCHQRADDSQLNLLPNSCSLTVEMFCMLFSKAQLQRLFRWQFPGAQPPASSLPLSTLKPSAASRETIPLGPCIHFLTSASTFSHLHPLSHFCIHFLTSASTFSHLHFTIVFPPVAVVGEMFLAGCCLPPLFLQRWDLVGSLKKNSSGKNQRDIKIRRQPCMEGLIKCRWGGTSGLAGPSPLDKPACLVVTLVSLFVSLFRKLRRKCCLFNQQYWFSTHKW